MNIKNWIYQNLMGSTRLIDKRCTYVWFEKNGILDIYNFIIQTTNFLNQSVTFSERLYCIINDIKKTPGCEICGSRVSYRSFKLGYRRSCSHTCSQLLPDTKLKVKKTYLYKYGVEHPLQLKHFQEKQRNTVQKKYGVSNISQAEEIKQKKKDTCIKNYGVEATMCSPELRRKAEETMLERYGVTNARHYQGFIDKSLCTRYGMSPDELQEYKRSYAAYEREVRNITEKQPLYLLENYEKRALAGTAGAYQLDHIYPVSLGFKNNIPAEIIGNIKNLRFITWEENNIKSDKLIEELIDADYIYQYKGE